MQPRDDDGDELMPNHEDEQRISPPPSDDESDNSSVSSNDSNNHRLLLQQEELRRQRKLQQQQQQQQHHNSDVDDGDFEEEEEETDEDHDEDDDDNGAETDEDDDHHKKPKGQQQQQPQQVLRNNNTKSSNTNNNNNNNNAKKGGGSGKKGNPSVPRLGIPRASFENLISEMCKVQHWRVVFEPLETCTTHCIEMVKAGVDVSDNIAREFLCIAIPDASGKLVSTDATLNWSDSIQGMAMKNLALIVELIAYKIPTMDADNAQLCVALAEIFNIRNQFHKRNYISPSMLVVNTDAYAVPHLVEVPPPPPPPESDDGSEGPRKGNNSNSSNSSDSDDDENKSKKERKRDQANGQVMHIENFRWLADLVNRFGECGGFGAIAARLSAFESASTSSPVEGQQQQQQQQQEQQQQQPSGDKTTPAAAPTPPILRALEMQALLAPLERAADVATEYCMKHFIEPAAKLVLNIVRKMTDKELKAERYDMLVRALESCCDILCRTIGFDEATRETDQIRMELALRMLKIQSFERQLGAVKEINALVGLAEESRSPKNQRNNCWLSVERIRDWVVENRILETALKSHLHHKQYVEQIAKLARFLLTEQAFTDEDLQMIWAATIGKHEAIVANLYEMLGSLAFHFQENHFDTLFLRFEKLDHSNPEEVLRFLNLISELARADSNKVMAARLLELLWTLAHSGKCLPEVQQRLLAEIPDLLRLYSFKTNNTKNNNNNNSVRFKSAAAAAAAAAEEDETATATAVAASENDEHTSKEEFARRCLTNIHSCSVQNSSVMAASTSVFTSLRLLRHILSLFPTQQQQQQQQQQQHLVVTRSKIVEQLCSTHSMLDLVVESLVAYMRQARAAVLAAVGTEEKESNNIAAPTSGAKFSPQIVETALVALNPPQTSHEEQVEERLQLSVMILNESSVELSWDLLCRVWDSLVVQGAEEDEDRDRCFQWLGALMGPIPKLASGCWRQLLNDKLQSVYPGDVTPAALVCFERTFCHVNTSLGYMEKCVWHATEGLKNPGVVADIEHLEGLDYLWNIALTVPDESLGEQCITWLRLIHTRVSKELAEKSSMITNLVLDKCFSHLSPTAAALRECAEGSPQEANLLRRSQRCLTILKEYITVSEAMHYLDRNIPSHGATYRGRVVTVNVSLAMGAVKRIAVPLHTNATIGSLKDKVGTFLGASGDRVRLFAFGTELKSDATVLRSARILGDTVVLATLSHLPAASQQQQQMTDDNETIATATPKNTMVIDTENSKSSELPGVLLASRKEAFDLLFMLADARQPAVRRAAWSLLMLIPSEPSTVIRLQQAVVTSPTGHSQDSAAASVLELLSQRKCMRTVYGIQLLDGILLPVRGQPSAELRNFFLQAGGCSQLLALLSGEDPLPHNLDQDIAVETYMIVMRLLKYLLLGVLPGDSQPPCPIPVAAPAAASAAGGAAGGKNARAALSVGLAARRGRGAALNTNNNNNAGENNSAHPVSHLPVSNVVGSLGRNGGIGIVGTLEATLDDFSTNEDASRKSNTSNDGRQPENNNNSNKLCFSNVNQECLEQLRQSDLRPVVTALLRLACTVASGRLGQHTSSGGGGENSGVERTGSSSSSSESSSPSSATSDPINAEYGPSENGGGGAAGRTFNNNNSGGSGADDQQKNNNNKIEARSLFQEASELLSFCLGLQPAELFEALFSVANKAGSSAVLDIVLRSPIAEVRDAACRRLYSMARMAGNRGIQILTEVLVHCRRETESFPANCGEFYALLHQLLIDYANLPPTTGGGAAAATAASFTAEGGDAGAKSSGKKSDRRVVEDLSDVLSLIQAEVASLTKSPPADDGVSFLLPGRLVMLQALFRFPTVNKTQAKELVEILLDRFLFSASAHWSQFRKRDIDPSIDLSHIRPLCSTQVSRRAGFLLLVELCRGCAPNFFVVNTFINSNHFVEDWGLKEFAFLPSRHMRIGSKWVGLKNASATCYINSVFQQIFMQPSLRSALLNVPRVDVPESDDLKQASEVFYELQRCLGFLQASQMEYYTPVGFWKSFRDFEGQPINVREHQDSFEFFCRLADQVDDFGAKTPAGKAFAKQFGGKFAQQIIGKDSCPHRSERDEDFLALPVEVRNKPSMAESLESFVKGDLLEGDNAYHCEQCGKKVSALKRVCIKELPPTLVVHLKRFDYDYQTMNRLKVKDYFEFPFVLDMEPYTVSGLSAREAGGNSGGAPQLYSLAGVLVHSGSAEAGHYYSFIRETAGRGSMEAERDQWWQFDDTSVDPYDISGHARDWFGGKVSTDLFDHQHRGMPTEYDRPYSAYILFYDKIDPLTPIPRTPPVVREELPLPQEVKRDVVSESLNALHDLSMLDEAFFAFMESLVVSQFPFLPTCGLGVSLDGERRVETNGVQWTDHLDTFLTRLILLSGNFLIRIFLKLHPSLREPYDWCAIMQRLIDAGKVTGACLLHSQFAQSKELRLLLTDCPLDNVRGIYGFILSYAWRHASLWVSSSRNQSGEEVLSTLLDSVIECIPEAHMSWEYTDHLWGFLSVVAQGDQRPWLTARGVVPALAETFVRSDVRRTCQPNLHATISTIIRSFDINSDSDGNSVSNPHAVPPLQAAELQSMQAINQSQYLQKALKVCADDPSIGALVLFLCWENRQTTGVILNQLRANLRNAQGLQTRSLLTLTWQLIELRDSLSDQRILNFLQFILIQLLSDRTTAPRRAYSLLKFVVQLANHNPRAREFMLSSQMYTTCQTATTWLAETLTASVVPPPNVAPPGAARMSNEDAWGHGLFRTESAQELCGLASNIFLHDTPMEDSTDGEEEEEEQQQQQ